ncbi:MAG: LysM peptidoglycan-binding domain-containing protein, partial [Anaerolineales bacterium]
LAVYGFLSEGKLNWNSIQYYPAGSGGGGGGGNGTGFYELNLSGTPVLFPSPTLQPESTQGNIEYIVKEGDTLFAIAEAYGITPEKIFQANGLSDGSILQVGMTLIIPGAQSQDPLIGKRFENQRGIFVVNIYRKSDGTQRKEYAFITSEENAYDSLVLEGDNLQELEKYHNRPVNIWAIIEKADDFGNLTAKVDRYEIPFPDLQIQILLGTQKTEIVADQPVELFTTEDGKTYVELDPSGGISNSILGTEGNAVIHEALAIPDETYGGYPTLHIFSSSVAENPKNGQATELTITADQPNILDESPDDGNYAPPALTIESVELVYYVPDPLYGTPDPNAGPQYLQPAWRFYGHYSDGSEVKFLVQALKQEFLLPELAPYTGPG